ncbi:MAG: trigger factor [Verrucomicrobiota bacterium]|nr:trigger factor [Verrucomicrobiota bacterium]
MNVEIKDAGTARKIALVTFDSDEVKTKETQTCNEIAKVANIPGFRKGKAPHPIIRKKFAKELKGELSRKVSTDAYEALLGRDDLKIYSVVKVDSGDFATDSPLTVEVTVDIEPEFDIPKYEEFELSIQPTDVSKDDVEKEINALLDQRASYEEVDRPVSEGDYVKCSYEGKIDGEGVADLLSDKPMYGKQTNTWVEAGNVTGLGVQAIAEGIVGMSKGESKEVKAEFDKDFELTPLAGKSVNYTLEVHEVREKKSATLDEDFLKSLKVEDEKTLRERMEKDLVARKERENLNTKRQQVTQKILEIPEFDLPQQAVDEESKIIFQGNIQRALQQGTKQEEIESKREELWNQALTQGQARVKLTLVLGKIAENEKVDVKNEDLAQAATQEAMMLRKDPTAYVKELSQDRQKLNRLRQDILYDKTLELIASKAKETICEIK